MSLLYLVGYVMFGLAIARAKILPLPIGVLFALGSVPLSIALMLPQWLETLGYAAIGGAMAWAGFLVWRNSPRVTSKPGATDGVAEQGANTGIAEGNRS
jgi:hypothetical protein